VEPPECIDIPGVFGGFILFTVSAFGYPKALTVRCLEALEILGKMECVAMKKWSKKNRRIFVSLTAVVL